MMNCIHLYILLLFTMRFTCAEIDREDDAKNEFSVINQGRMYSHTVLMFLEEIPLEECANYCIMHLNCHTVSYSSSARLCELNNMEFDEAEADKDAVGWVNYGTPAKVDGGFSDWKNLTECSATCGEGHVTYYRSCDNPKPQQGGADCHGNQKKTEPCLIQDCLVCYGAKDNNYGEVVVRKSGQLKAIHLTHVSGYLKCTPFNRARWGCSYYGNKAFTVIVTDGNNNWLFPGPFSSEYYRLKSSTIYDDEITIFSTNPITVHKDQYLRIWCYEDIKDSTEYNNSGEHCVHVDLVYEN